MICSIPVVSWLLPHSWPFLSLKIWLLKEPYDPVGSFPQRLVQTCKDVNQSSGQRVNKGILILWLFFDVSLMNSCYFFFDYYFSNTSTIKISFFRTAKSALSELSIEFLPHNHALVEISHWIRNTRALAIGDGHAMALTFTSILLFLGTLYKSYRKK